MAGYFLPKIAAKISKKIYFVPCSEFTIAGFAKDMEKINKISDKPADI